MEVGSISPSPSFDDAAQLNLSYGARAIGRHAPKQILVVEDDPEIRELVARTITRAGFQVDTAGDGEEAWNALCLTAYDLVITDHEMPRLTGLKLIERIRAISVEPPCILISCNLPGSASTLREILYPGALLAKPFSGVQLIERVFGLLLHGDFEER
jgi:DNA-binding response OmpR family regulator